MLLRSDDPMENETRVVLVKPGDVLVFGNVGPIDADQVEAITTGLRDVLGFDRVAFFESDIDLAAVPNG
jgi:hypothetical protein